VPPRVKLALVFLACAAPFVLGWAAWYFNWATGASGNYGELIAPRTLSGPPLDELRGKWVFVAFDSAACNEYCEKKLYFMRQVRKAQGKEQARLERLWVITDAGTPRAELLAAIEGTRISKLKLDGFAGNPADHIYLVDPLGNLMMRYDARDNPKGLLQDLQKLLKLSHIG
jgi:cytochrome oxidase Cu insertion factor (SCO1/SenC/PrrC family)